MENGGMITKGGDGPYSYSKNSEDQAEGSNLAKDLLRNDIKEFLEVSKDSRLISIADLGCSIGPNTFTCINNIIKSVQETLKINQNLDFDLDHHHQEFQVFFNDLVNNDFNTLFKSLPSSSSSSYYVAGVPGPFQKRLFPKSSINIMHSSFALNWLSKIPQEIKDYNNGRITYALSSKEICSAYIDQYVKDVTDFFKARSDELVHGGLLMILLPCRKDDSLPSQSDTIQLMECVGDVLQDMVNEGLTSEDLFNTFNVPVFFPTVSEIKQALSNVNNNNLKIMKYEQIFLEPKLETPEKIQYSKMHLRAVMDDLLLEHFGPELIDEIFDRFPSKLEKLSKSNPRFVDHSYVEKNDRIVYFLIKYI